jgi:hypothetical protein
MQPSIPLLTSAPCWTSHGSIPPLLQRLLLYHPQTRGDEAEEKRDEVEQAKVEAGDPACLSAVPHADLRL